MRLSHPDRWEELSSPQFTALARMLTDDPSIDEITLLSTMLNVPKRVVRRFNMYQKYKLGELLDFLANHAPVNRFVVKKISRLSAPADNLDDVTFAEFIHMDTFYMDYLESKSMEDRAKLVGCIYVRYKEGKRPLFDGNINTNDVALISPADQEGAVLNYGLVRTWLSKAYPEVFPDAEAIGSNTNKRGGGWLSVYDALVGDDIINADSYANRPCMEVLRYMNRKIKENRKQRRARE